MRYSISRVAGQPIDVQGQPLEPAFQDVATRRVLTHRVAITLAACRLPSGKQSQRHRFVAAEEAASGSLPGWSHHPGVASVEAAQHGLGRPRDSDQAEPGREVEVGHARFRECGHFRQHGTPMGPIYSPTADHSRRELGNPRKAEAE